MSIPAKLSDHVKHVFVSSAQRDVLIRIAEAVELLNERCACVNTITVSEPEPQPAAPDEDPFSLSDII